MPVEECKTRDTTIAGVVSDLGQGCLQRLSVRRNTSRERVNTIFLQIGQTNKKSIRIPDKDRLGT